MSETSRVEPARRGSLLIDRAVFEKVAGQAAVEVDGVGRAGGGLALRRTDHFSGIPKATVMLEGDHARINLTVGVVFPTPLTELGDRLRAHCAERVAELTGVVVDRVDVRIDWLGRAEREAAPR